jgi:adenine deaminase
MRQLRMPQLIERVRELEQLLAERGHLFHDPIYTLLFLSSEALPDLRLTPAGLFLVKSREVLLEPESLR